MTVEVYQEPPLGELVSGNSEISLVNDLHRQAQGALRSWALAAIEIGQTLIAFQDRLAPDGEWDSWVERNLQFSMTLATLYIRTYFYRDQVLSSNAVTSAEVKAALHGLPVRRVERPRRTICPPELERRILSRRRDGVGWKTIAHELGLPRNQIKYWADPEWRKRQQAVARRRARRAREARAALSRQEEDSGALVDRQLLRASPRAVSSSYALIRKIALELDSAITASTNDLERAALRVAREHVHRVDDAIVAAIRGKSA